MLCPLCPVFFSECTSRSAVVSVRDPRLGWDAGALGLPASCPDLPPVPDPLKFILFVSSFQLVISMITGGRNLTLLLVSVLPPPEVLTASTGAGVYFGEGLTTDFRPAPEKASPDSAAPTFSICRRYPRSSCATSCPLGCLCSCLRARILPTIHVEQFDTR